MTVKLLYALPFFALALPLVTVPAGAQAGPPKDKPGYEWPSHYDFYVPYGTKGGGPVYAKPAYKGVNLILSCREAVGLLKLKGYENIEELSCSGSSYRFRASRDGGRLDIEFDPRTGDVLNRHRL
ncbi:MAG: hypothetical protein ACOZAM_16255 [Pseudomonadota bacterium]